MPFLGNTPANTFVSIAKQTITGNGGTTYALSYPVTNANEIDVFFNNVRQEPTVAYTASGTTIVFSEAIASTDAVYVIFNGQAVGTIDAPAGAYLPTTGGTVSGNVTLNKNWANNVGALTLTGDKPTIRMTSNDVYGQWLIHHGSNNNGSLQFYRDTTGSNNWTKYLDIDPQGRVTLPYQPSFYAYGGSQQNPGSLYTVQFNTASVNIGNCYNTSTYKFTAPVSGTYVFTFTAMSNGGYNRFALYKNNSEYSGQRFSTNQGYENFGATWIITLATNDYVEIKNDLQSNGQGDIHTDYRNFGGYLLG